MDFLWCCHTTLVSTPVEEPGWFLGLLNAQIRVDQGDS
jgi:hypothetical protein